MRPLWFICGSLSLIVGFIGIVVPLLPTVPLVLLAAFCFARSSDRVHRWLLTRRIFGPMISDWNQNGAISRNAKLMATASILGVFLISVILALKFFVLAVQFVVLGMVLIFIWTRPDA